MLLSHHFKQSKFYWRVRHINTVPLYKSISRIRSNMPEKPVTPSIEFTLPIIDWTKETDKFALRLVFKPACKSCSVFEQRMQTSRDHNIQPKGMIRDSPTDPIPWRKRFPQIQVNLTIQSVHGLTYSLLGGWGRMPSREMEHRRVEKPL